MFRQNGKCLVLCLCIFLIGILIGGCIDAACPRPNHIHMTVTSYGKVNVSPIDGDIIDWVPYDTTQTLTIQFDPFYGIPCDPGGDPNVCHYNPSQSASIAPYNCIGQATCPDPGVGPPGDSGSIIQKGLFTSFAGKVAKSFDNFALTIDRFLGFAPTPAGLKPSPAPAGQNPTAGQANGAASRSASIVGPDGVKCNDGTTVVQTPSLSANPGDTIVWLSGTSTGKFTVALPAICTASTSTPALVQQCTLLANVGAGTYNYTATTQGCSQSTAPYTVSVPASAAGAPKK